MDFTREPIIETIITPKEGYRLIVRSSKNMGQEEYFVDAIEVVCFGKAFFFRSTERPKPFLVPVNDYEILEVREQRLVLKTALTEGSVKIAGGRDSNHRASRDEGRRESKREVHPPLSDTLSGESAPSEARPVANEGRPSDRRRGDRRRGGNGFRRRRGGGGKEDSIHEEFRGAPMDEATDIEPSSSMASTEGAAIPRNLEHPMLSEEKAQKPASLTEADALSTTTFLRSVLPPPTTLIRDDLERLRGNDAYRGAFFVREGKEDPQDDNDIALDDIHNEHMEFSSSSHSSYEEKGASFEEEPFLFSSSHEKEIHKDVSDDLL